MRYKYTVEDTEKLERKCCDQVTFSAKIKKKYFSSLAKYLKMDERSKMKNSKLLQIKTLFSQFIRSNMSNGKENITDKTKRQNTTP